MFPTTATAPEQIVRELLADARVRRAFELFVERADELTREQAAICEIPAPPFGEEARAEYLSARFRQCGLREALIDAEGNCVALRRGANLHPLVVISAHLDTVFPAGTNFTVRREGARMFAPGIADDGCGLVALLALASALTETKIETKGSILFVATVGEEGEGNLRGARYLLTRGEWAREIDAFVSLDGPGIEGITHRAVGSRRYRVRCAGAGGHSWGDFGVPNPLHALGRTIARLVAYPAPARPRTTFNVGRVEGGAGVNCIAQEALMDVDLRSESPDELKRLDAYFRRAAREAAEEENAVRRRDTPPLELDMKLIGDRPGGETPKDAPLVRLAEAATRALGATPRLDCSSTDSNIAISLGVPAITVGAGGLSANSHTLDEWYDPRGRELALNRALLLLLGTVGMR
ncbi:MAG TPA: M20/M25/M40 family metallo-hydrolase [Pyrinomonadaceae bacterium]|nr:M20/M25/M40 family metallo-hydrolase [Pyrinomonadaceae bacterium]